ncbi:MAG: hypothetical protein IGR92_06470 [Leptolyngbyaceae cyanobacterium T60_A2020_046]|nr:hypothetical protein [Leptolyngbyaceae cyanobacterium T60_A2020_046]
MAALARPRIRRKTKLSVVWFERIMALIALANLLIVCFDLSYIRFRDLYLRFFPEFTWWYGEVFKGIEPERATETYLETVSNLEEQVAQTGLQSIQAETLLGQLQEQSRALIDENPFQIANKTGTLERIKNMMRDRVGKDSAKAAFETFWSVDYLTTAGWSRESRFFNDEIAPLMRTNYFRGIGEDGGPINLFGLLDGWFVMIFGAELLLRSIYISRRYKNTNLLDAILLRWYDLFLLIPFWRWLRVIPTMIRLNQSHTVNLVPLRNRINRVFITNFAVELTEVVILRIVDQAQNLIREGDVARWVLDAGSGRRYIDLNGVNELQGITNRVTTLLVYQVLPKLKPEIDALLHHSVTGAFQQAPGYQGFRQIPGIGSLPDQLAQQVVEQVSQNVYGALTGALEDEKGAELMQQLVERLGTAVREEVQKDATIEELQALLVALLEEVKVNYVRRLAAEDVERLMEENYRIYNITQER